MPMASDPDNTFNPGSLQYLLDQTTLNPKTKPGLSPPYQNIARPLNP